MDIINAFRIPSNLLQSAKSGSYDSAITSISKTKVGGKMFRCEICETLKDEVIFTTSDKLGGLVPNIPVTVCDHCMDNIESYEEALKEKSN